MDFALLMFLGIVFTGSVWLGDRVFFAPARREAALRTDGSVEVREPTLVEYCRAFFPVIVVVFLVRSFVVEPFRIPSGSMLPTLEVGDFILVNKFVFGLRLPILHQEIVDFGEPQRGDVVVFRYPPKPSVDYIKRVVGVPGDHIAYYDKILYVNGKAVTDADSAEVQPAQSGPDRVLLGESQNGHSYRIQWMRGIPSREGEREVPPGHYFVMGDNRDNSKDSRIWGFVPESHFVGKAFMIWMSWDAERFRVDIDRIGDIIR